MFLDPAVMISIGYLLIVSGLLRLWILRKKRKNRDIAEIRRTCEILAEWGYCGAMGSCEGCKAEPVIPETTQTAFKRFSEKAQEVCRIMAQEIGVSASQAAEAFRRFGEVVKRIDQRICGFEHNAGHICPRCGATGCTGVAWSPIHEMCTSCVIAAETGIPPLPYVCPTCLSGVGEADWDIQHARCNACVTRTSGSSSSSSTTNPDWDWQRYMTQRVVIEHGTEQEFVRYRCRACDQTVMDVRIGLGVLDNGMLYNSWRDHRCEAGLGTIVDVRIPGIGRVASTQEELSRGMLRLRLDNGADERSVEFRNGDGRIDLRYVPVHDIHMNGDQIILERPGATRLVGNFYGASSRLEEARIDPPIEWSWEECLDAQVVGDEVLYICLECLNTVFRAARREPVNDVLMERAWDIHTRSHEHRANGWNWTDHMNRTSRSDGVIEFHCQDCGRFVAQFNPNVPFQLPVLAGAWTRHAAADHNHPLEPSWNWQNFLYRRRYAIRSSRNDEGVEAIGWFCQRCGGSIQEVPPEIAEDRDVLDSLEPIYQRHLASCRGAPPGAEQSTVTGNNWVFWVRYMYAATVLRNDGTTATRWHCRNCRRIIHEVPYEQWDEGVASLRSLWEQHPCSFQESGFMVSRRREARMTEEMAARRLAEKPMVRVIRFRRRGSGTEM